MSKQHYNYKRQRSSASSAAAAQPQRMQKPKTQSFDSSSMPLVEDHFINLDRSLLLGSGTFGIVQKVLDLKQQGTMVALKMFDSKQKHYDELAVREIDALRRLKNAPYIVQLLGNYKDKAGNLYIALDLATYDLGFLLKGGHIRLWSLEQLKACMFQIVMGVKSIHDARLMHRDLKPENILVYTKDNLFKICDFGMVNNVKQNYKTYSNPVTTLWYRDPQLLLGTTTYGPEVDMWSLACIFGALLLDGAIFQGDKTDQHQMLCIWSLCGTPLKEEVDLWPFAIREALKIQIERHYKPRGLATRIGKGAANVKCKRWFKKESTFALFDSMLTLTPCRRMTVEQVLKHAWFTEEKILEPWEMVPLPPRRPAAP